MSLIATTFPLQMTPENQFMAYREKEGTIVQKLALGKNVYDTLMKDHSIEAISIFMENEAATIKENPFLYRITQEDADLFTPDNKTLKNDTVIIIFKWFNNEGKKVYHIDEVCYCLFSEIDLLRIDDKDKGIYFSLSLSLN